MHIVRTERQTDHKSRTQCQNSNKGVEVQVSAPKHTPAWFYVAM